MYIKDDTILLNIEWLFLVMVRTSECILMDCCLMYGNKGKKKSPLFLMEEQEVGDDWIYAGN